MKIIIGTVLNIILVFSVFQSISQDRFSENDTLIVLNAVKNKNETHQDRMKMPLYTKNGWILDKIFPEINGIPDSLHNTKVHYMYLNFDQALLQAYKSNLITKKNFEKYFKKTNLGQTECINEYVKTFVIVVTGTSSSNEKYYMIDFDNDLNIGNEKCLPVNENESFFINSNLQNIHTHKILFERVNNGKIVQEHTWITLLFKEKQLHFYFDEYTSCEFQFESTKYNIKAFPSPGPVVNYGSPSFFEIKNNTTSTTEKRNYNEYIKLSNSYYRISCNADGRKIKLTKENDAQNKGGTQCGMPPITFTANDLNDKLIDFPTDFKNKYILLDFWATSCAPCVHEITTTYKDLYQKYGTDKFEIVGVANNSSIELTNFIEKHKVEWIIIPDGEAKKVQKMYEVFAFPTLYLINAQGKIIAKDNELRGNKLEILLDELIKNK